MSIPFQTFISAVQQRLGINQPSNPETSQKAIYDRLRQEGDKAFTDKGWVKGPDGAWYQKDQVPQVLPIINAQTPTIPPTQQSPHIIPGFTTWNPPTQLSQLVLDKAQKYRIPPALLAGIIQTESGFTPNKVNKNTDPDTGITSRDRGYAQINDYYHPEVTDQQANDPNFSIDFAAKLFANGVKQHGDLAQGLASYNVGNRVGFDPSRDQNGLGPKGRDYVNKVLKNVDLDTLKSLGLNSQY